MTEEINKLKPKKSFGDYYRDPEFKKKHLARMQEKIECSVCGGSISRSNMTKHQKTIRHQQVTKKIQEAVTKVETEKMVEMLQKFIINAKAT